MAELLTWHGGGRRRGKSREEDTAFKDRDCFLYQTPPSWLLEPEATVRDLQKAVRWLLGASCYCFSLSDVVTEYQSFVSYTALGAGNGDQRAHKVVFCLGLVV